MKRIIALIASLGLLLPAISADLASARVPLGINIGLPEFVDAMKTSRAWETLDGKPAPVDAAGWPAADARTVVFDNRVNMPWNGPDPQAIPPDDSGTYRLSFSGQADLGTQESGSRIAIWDQRYNATKNTTTADVVVPKDDHLLILTFTHSRRTPESPAGSGVRDVRLLRPGFPAGTRQVFTQAFLKALAPFPVVRLMDYGSTNNYPNFDGTSLIHTRWEDRRLPTDATQQDSGRKRGGAWEYAIQLANETGKDLWICVPVSADDGYVRSLARLLRTSLNPGRRVYLEYSNEVWNWGFPQATWNKMAAIEEVKAGGSVLNADGETDENSWAFRRYGKRTVEITRIFQSVFGREAIPKTIRPVLVWQEGMDGALWSIVRWMESVYGPPKGYLYGLGNAPYYDPSDFSSPEAYFASLDRSSRACRAVTERFTALATYYGVKNVGYEGGTGSVDTKHDMALQFAAHRDPRMRESIRRHIRDSWFAAGGDVLCYFNLHGTFGPYGAWSVLEGDYTRTGAPKYRALLDVLRAPRPAVTAGWPLPEKAGAVREVPLTGGTARRPAPGEVVGMLLLRGAGAGRYAVRITGGQDAPETRLDFSVDDRPAGAVALPVQPAPAGISKPVTVDLSAGLHTVMLQVAGKGRCILTPDSHMLIQRVR